MSCACEQKKAMSDYDRVASLAKKAAVLDQCVYVVYQREDGTYAFDKADEITENIIEFKYPY